jgi:ribosome-associated translation inhibitor RaiA
VTSHYEPRTPFAAQGSKLDKRSAGRTDAPETPLELRSSNGEINEDLRAWVYERLSRQLGKYATQIERMQVRFGDVNGDRGGVGKTCVVHVVLSSLPPVVIEVTGESEREAFDLAAGRAERATRHSVEKHGFTTRSQKRPNGPLDGEPSAEPVQAAESQDGWTVDDSTAGDGAYDAHVHHHGKPDASLTLRTRSASQSSKAQAERAAARRVR